LTETLILLNNWSAATIEGSLLNFYNNTLRYRIFTSAQKLTGGPCTVPKSGKIRKNHKQKPSSSERSGDSPWRQSTMKKWNYGEKIG